MKYKTEVGDHATEHDLWQHGFAIVKVLHLKDFQNIDQEDFDELIASKRISGHMPRGVYNKWETRNVVRGSITRC
jgi:hypothetical protein